MSKKIKIPLIILLILFIIALCLGAYYLYSNKDSTNDENEVKAIKKIDDYGYELKENETQLYKDTFDELVTVLSKDEVSYEDYAKTIAKLFIIDFYTLDNKLSKNDIGGLDFIKDSMKDNFVEEARSTFYKYVEVKSENRTQKLPIVSEITNVSLENTSFTYADKTVDENAYRVTITWEYKEDLGYENEAKMIIVKDDKKLYVVEMD